MTTSMIQIRGLLNKTRVTEWMITILKNVSDKYKLNQKLTISMLLKKYYYNPMTQFWNIYFQKVSKNAFLLPFLSTLLILFFANRHFFRYGCNICLHISRKELLDVQGPYFLVRLSIFGTFSYLSVKRVGFLLYFPS